MRSTKNKRHATISFSILSFGLLQAGCGAKSAVDSATSSSLSMTVMAKLDVVQGAKITVINAKTNAELGSCISASDGQCQLSAASTSDPVIVKFKGYDKDGDGVSDAKYISEATGEAILVPLAQEFKSFVPSMKSGDKIHITTLTDQAASLAIKSMGALDSVKYSADDYKQFMEKANKQIEETYGIPKGSVGEFPAAGSNGAYALGAMDQYMKNNGFTGNDMISGYKFLSEKMKDGQIDSTIPSGYESKFAALGENFMDPSKGFERAISDWSSNPNCPEADKAFYVTNAANYATPDTTPQKWVDSYKNYFDQKAGGTFTAENDPCKDPSSTSCPSFSNYDPGQYDKYLADKGISYVPPGYDASTYDIYKGSGESTYTLPEGTLASTIPTATSYTGLMLNCAVSGSTATVDIKKYDNTAPTSVAYTYSVMSKSYNPSTYTFTETSIVSSTSGSTSSLSFSMPTANTSYFVEVSVSAPSEQKVNTYCYRSN